MIKFSSIFSFFSLPSKVISGGPQGTICSAGTTCLTTAAPQKRNPNAEPKKTSPPPPPPATTTTTKPTATNSGAPPAATTNEYVLNSPPAASYGSWSTYSSWSMSWDLGRIKWVDYQTFTRNTIYKVGDMQFMRGNSILSHVSNKNLSMAGNNQAAMLGAIQFYCLQYTGENSNFLSDNEKVEYLIHTKFQRDFDQSMGSVYVNPRRFASAPRKYPIDMTGCLTLSLDQASYVWRPKMLTQYTYMLSPVTNLNVCLAEKPDGTITLANCNSASKYQQWITQNTHNLPKQIKTSAGQWVGSWGTSQVAFQSKNLGSNRCITTDDSSPFVMKSAVCNANPIFQTWIGYYPPTLTKLPN